MFSLLSAIADVDADVLYDVLSNYTIIFYQFMPIKQYQMKKEREGDPPVLKMSVNLQ